MCIKPHKLLARLSLRPEKRWLSYWSWLLNFLLREFCNALVSCLEWAWLRNFWIHHQPWQLLGTSPQIKGRSNNLHISCNWGGRTWGRAKSCAQNFASSTTCRTIQCKAHYCRFVQHPLLAAPLSQVEKASNSGNAPQLLETSLHKILGAIKTPPRVSGDIIGIFVQKAFCI